MPIFEPGPLLGSQSTQYQISRSLRFRSSASAYLSRTPASAGNRQKWTWSGWVKRSKSGINNIFGAGWSGSGYFDTIRFPSGDTLQVYLSNSAGTGTEGVITTSAVYRDYSSWYHIIIACDTTQATSTNRVIIYINGLQATVSGTYPSLNFNSTYLNTANVHRIGAEAYLSTPGSAECFDGYLAEVNFIDGQALTPSSFGAFDTNGVWQPAKYTGSYTGNSFYLPFTNSSAIGTDSSGLGNNWTPSASINTTSSGVTYDWMLDSPTNYADGGNGRGNYAVLSPIDKASTFTLANANLTFSTVGGTNNYDAVRGTFALPSSGKWYWEVTYTVTGYLSRIGITSGEVGFLTSGTPVKVSAIGVGSGAGLPKYFTDSNTGSAWSGATNASVNDVYMVAVDMDNGSMWIGKNGTWFNTSGTANPATNTDPRWTGLSGYTWFPFQSESIGPPISTTHFNFGQRPFTYTPPSGFSALNTQNLPTPTIAAGNKYFDALLYTGANPNAAKTVTGLGFQPDFVWIKSRVTGYGHGLFDVARGVNKRLQSDTTGAEATSSTYLTAFNSDGFSLGTDYGQNAPSEPYVSWNWNAGGAPTTDNVAGAGNVPTAGSVKINGSNSGSALAGSIAATRLSANTSAGFSVVTYISNGVNGATIGHGLGVTPSLVIVKARYAGTTQNWAVYHSSIGATQYLLLNSTAAAATSATYWNNTAPDSSKFTIGTSNDVNINSSVYTYVAYCFAPVAGYSAFGSYTGNGSTDGPFIFTGFRPRWVICKRADSTSDWIINDTTRDAYNNTSKRLFANDPGVESGTYDSMDILSNGIKMRNSNSINISGGTFIYAAFAENPFKTSRAR